MWVPFWVTVAAIAAIIVRAAVEYALDRRPLPAEPLAAADRRLALHLGSPITTRSDSLFTVGHSPS
jgi:hypothetical protein